MVDDEELMLRDARRVFRTHALDAASSPREALSLLERRHYDCVVSDVCFGPTGKRAGLEFICQLREVPWLGAVVLLSGVLGDRIEHEARVVGADAWLPKHEWNQPNAHGAVERAIQSAAARGDSIPGVPEPIRSLPVQLRDLTLAALDARDIADAAHAESGYRVVVLAGAADRHECLPGGIDPSERCAAALGLSDESMRQYALVASRWSAGELYQLLVVRRNSSGERLTATHLYEIARHPGAIRGGWVERAFTESLSVRALREALSPKHRAD
jgi:DNA-binding NarL/FixJ family response regulator